MQTKHLALSIFTALSLMGASSFAKQVAIDTNTSKVQWLGKKVTGQHNGTVKLKSGTVDIEGSNIKSGNFDMDMTSIVVEDLKDATYNKKLTDHLKSDDFFGVDKFPVSSFKITSVKPIKNKKDGTHEITGDLTIKGVTHPVTFPATVEVKNGVATAKGKAVIDRTKYNIRYGSGKFFQNLGDKMIDDTFQVDLDLQAKI